MDWNLLTRVMAVVVAVTLVIQYILQAIDSSSHRIKNSSRLFPANDFEIFVRENREKSKDGDNSDTKWNASRQGSMSSGRSKVIVFSYMRGGSTLFSNVFNIEPESTILWYEALDGFHAHHSGLPFYSNPLQLLYHKNLTRRASDHETVEEMTTYLSDLLDCNVRRLPIETVAHRFVSVSKALKTFWKCMKTNDPLSLFSQRQPSASICQRLHFEEEEEGKGEGASKHRIDCRTALRFLRRVKNHSTMEMREEEEEMMYRLFLNETNGSDSCGRRFERASDPDKDHLSGSDETASPGLCQRDAFIFKQLFAAVNSMRKVDEKTRICRDILDEVCETQEEPISASAAAVVVGIHRASFADLAPLIQRMPEVKVVFYVRDPRAIAVSRSDPLTNQTFLVTSDWTAVNESALLCRRMLEDIHSRKEIGRKNPGSIVTLRYEDFVERPREVVAALYDAVLRRSVPEGFDRWVEETMHSPTYDGIYGIRRLNAREHISRWRSKVTAAERRAMTDNCLGVLQELGYEYN